jgi:HEPN domain-containing protein
MKKLAAAWIRKAESDFRVARKLAGMQPPAHDEVCFHSQQAAGRCGQRVIR